MMRSLAVLLLAFPTWAAGASPSDTVPPRDSTPSIDKLAASVDRLVGLLERELAIRTDERDARKVEVALGILELRNRKIDRLESEIQQINQDEDQSGRELTVMRGHAEQLAKQPRDANGELPEIAKQDIAMMELRVKAEEDRIARLRDRRGMLQNDVAAERRRLASLEAILDGWLDKQ